MIANTESIICFKKSFSICNFVNNHFDISIMIINYILSSMEEQV